MIDKVRRWLGRWINLSWACASCFQIAYTELDSCLCASMRPEFRTDLVFLLYGNGGSYGSYKIPIQSYTFGNIFVITDSGTEYLENVSVVASKELTDYNHPIPDFALYKISEISENFIIIPSQVSGQFLKTLGSFSLQQYFTANGLPLLYSNIDKPLISVSAAIVNLGKIILRQYNANENYSPSLKAFGQSRLINRKLSKILLNYPGMIQNSLEYSYISHCYCYAMRYGMG